MLTDSELVKLDRIEFENKLAVFPDECREWLCSLVRRLRKDRSEELAGLRDEIQGLENEVEEKEARIEELKELTSKKKKVK